MITNTALATALNQDRRRRFAERQRFGFEAGIEPHIISRSVGRRLEGWGRWLQRSARATRSHA